MKIVTALLIGFLSSSAWGAVPHAFQRGLPAVAAEVNENFNALDARIEGNAASLASLTSEVACDTVSLAGWWTFSQTDGKYSLVCVAYMDENGIAEADVGYCEIADRGSDDDNYVVNDTLTMVAPAVSEGSWSFVQEMHGCVVNATFIEPRGLVTIKANVGRHGDSIAGWGRYPTEDLFGLTGIRTSVER